MSSAPYEPLAHLGFQLIAPKPSLRPYVQSYWVMEAVASVYRAEYMHPSGGFGVMFNFGDTLQLDGQTISEPVVLDGANTVSRQAGFLGRVDLLGIRFHEGGAYPFLGVPLHELRNAIPVLDALDRVELLRLHARLAEVKSTPTRITLLDHWLSARLALGTERHALIAPSLIMLRMAAGRLPIPELAHKLAVSQRQLERLYQTQVGMSPKQYAQLRRVEAARRALKHSPLQSTAQLALELGYYDQAHFIREFSAVVGLTPYAYLKRRPKPTPVTK